MAVELAADCGGNRLLATKTEAGLHPARRAPARGRVCRGLEVELLPERRKDERKEGRQRQRSEVREVPPTAGPRPDAAEPLDSFSLWTITLDHSTLSPMPTDTMTTSCVHHPPIAQLPPSDSQFLSTDSPLPVFYLPFRPSLPSSLYSFCFGPPPLPLMSLASHIGPTHPSWPSHWLRQL